MPSVYFDMHKHFDHMIICSGNTLGVVYKIIVLIRAEKLQAIEVGRCLLDQTRGNLQQGKTLLQTAPSRQVQPEKVSKGVIMSQLLFIANNE